MKKVLSEKPDDLEAQVLAIRSLRLSNYLDEALSRSESLEEKYPNNADIKEEIGRTYLVKNYVDTAEEKLESSYYKFPNNQRLGRALVLTYRALNENEKALSLINKLLILNPIDPRNIQSKMNILNKLGKFDESIEICKKFRNEHPNEFNYSMWTGNGIYVPLSKNLILTLIKNARVILQKEHHLWSKIENEEVIINFALTENAKEMLNEANDEIEKLLFDINVFHEAAAEIDTADLIQVKADCLSMLGRFREELVLRDELIAKNDDIFKIVDKARTLYRLREFKEAIVLFDKYLNEFPTDNSALKTRWKSYLGAGELEKFEQERKRLMETGVLENNKSTNQIQKFDKTEIPISPETPYDNLIWTQKLFESRQGFVWIKDRYFRRGYLEFLRDNINFESVKEIKILRQGTYYENGKQFYTETRKLIKEIQKFNEQHNDILVIGVHFKDDFHDRYLMSENDVWNIPGFEQFEEGDISDLKKIDDEVTIKIRKEQFAKLWGESKPMRDEKSWLEILKDLKKELKSQKKDVCKEIEEKIISSN